jgi:hypothetical protein
MAGTPVPEGEAYRHFEEYPRAAALEWEPLPHEEIEAEEQYQRLEAEQDRLFSKSNHKILVVDSNPVSGTGEGMASATSLTTAPKLTRYVNRTERVLVHRRE